MNFRMILQNESRRAQKTRQKYETLVPADTPEPAPEPGIFPEPVRSLTFPDTPSIFPLMSFHFHAFLRDTGLHFLGLLAATLHGCKHPKIGHPQHCRIGAQIKNRTSTDQQRLKDCKD